MKKGISTTMAVLITVVVMLAMAVGGYYYLDTQQKNQTSTLNDQIGDLRDEVASLQKSVDDNSSTAAVANTNSQSSSATTSNTTTVDSYLYTNSTYGFTLQFNSKWKGYQMMPADGTGATKTYYVCLPTTETTWQKATSSSLAGTASVFAISVYSKAQWATVSAEEGPVPTKIGETGSWVVAYSTAQDFPQDGTFTAAVGDYKNVTATFKAI